MSKFLLLQTASPDAIVRLECTALSDEKDSSQIYSEEQYHRSMTEFLHHFVHTPEAEGGLLLQVLDSIGTMSYDYQCECVIA
jgi:hypothetical protein